MSLNPSDNPKPTTRSQTKAYTASEKYLSVGEGSEPAADTLTENIQGDSPMVEVKTSGPDNSLTGIREMLKQLASLELQRATASPEPVVQNDKFNKGPNARAPDSFHGKDKSKLRPYHSALRVVFFQSSLAI